MSDCMILGDSVAVGVAMYRPDCVSFARGGWNSWQWNRDYGRIASDRPVSTVIISLGPNDHAGVRSEDELRKMRRSLQTARVFWIDPGPRKPVPRSAIERIAAEYGDRILARPEMSPDGVHPTPNGYRSLGDQTR